MTLFENFDRKIPEYYPTMYKDGYTPEEIRYALYRKMLKNVEKEDNLQDVKIVSEVKIK